MSTKTGLMVVSLALSIVIGVVISKSGATSGDADRAGPGGRQLLIGLSLDTLKEARWQADSELFQAKCKELGAKVLVQAANSDDTRQINDCQSLLTSNVDVLVIVAHDSDAMAKAVRLAHDTNTPGHRLRPHHQQFRSGHLPLFRQRKSRPAAGAVADGPYAQARPRQHCSHLWLQDRSQRGAL